MTTSNERLKQARETAGYESAQAAADAFGWPIGAYRHHENGSQGRSVPAKEALKYARAFRVRPEWILWGEGSKDIDYICEEIPVYGYAGAREVVDIIPSDDQGPIDEVQPLRAEDGFRAVVVRGHSMLPAFRDGDVLFFREDHIPIDQLIGRDCIILTEDKERAYVKRIMKGSKKGHYTLLSYAPGIDPLPDVKVLKAWPIEWIRRK
jgi:phage repressor protein C with HTH and peptisase S24 domain